MEPTTSEYILVKNSKVHGSGVFAKKFIPKGTKIIEYVGEKLTKEQGDRRSEEQLEFAKSNPHLGAVYIFELDDDWDIDGNFDYNTARLINHSCDPNCEFEIADGHIWIFAKRDIKEGEELNYNYGYDYEDYEEHPCKCGSANCVGYILEEEHWPKLKEDLEKKKIKNIQ
ncbi:MAG: SET domain-containing protein-lysine N-methyltransferase [Candidatus Pacearchaeota archaeon]|jgi:hypothetical protein